MGSRTRQKPSDFSGNSYKVRELQISELESQLTLQDESKVSGKANVGADLTEKERVRFNERIQELVESLPRSNNAG